MLKQEAHLLPDFTQLIERLPGEVSRLRGPEWTETTTMMERGRDQALAQMPLGRPALRIVPASVVPPHAATPNPAAMAPFVVPEAVRAMSGGESPA